MALVAGQAQLRAKLQTKGKLRPYNVVRKKLPDGSGMLEELPERAPGASPNDEAADAAYCKAIQRVSNVFGKQRRSQTTADEHKMYGRLFDGWLVRKGFGSYFESEYEHGRCVAVRARRREDGTHKVVRAEMLSGALRDMSVGSESAPKGGHASDIAARAGMEVASACGKR